MLAYRRDIDNEKLCYIAEIPPDAFVSRNFVNCRFLKVTGSCTNVEKNKSDLKRLDDARNNLQVHSRSSHLLLLEFS